MRKHTRKRFGMFHDRSVILHRATDPRWMAELKFPAEPLLGSRKRGTHRNVQDFVTLLKGTRHRYAASTFNDIEIPPSLFLVNDTQLRTATVTQNSGPLITGNPDFRPAASAGAPS